MAHRLRLLCFPFLAALLVLAGVPALAADAQPALVTGDAVPLMAGNELDGTPTALYFPHHKLTVINFFATWCEPCHEEMPMLQRLHEELGDDGLNVVGVIHEAIDSQRMSEFLDSIGVDYFVFYPRSGMARTWGGISYLPVTFLVDSEGMLVRRYLGATSEQIEGLEYDVRAYLDGKSLGPIIVPENPNVVHEDERPRQRR